MKVYIDEEFNVCEGRSLRVSRGDELVLRIYCQAGDWDFIKFGVKAVHDGEFMVYADSFVRVGDCYEAAVNFNTKLLEEALGDDCSIVFPAEVEFSRVPLVGDCVVQTVRGIRLQVYQDLIKGDEFVPEPKDSYVTKEFVNEALEWVAEAAGSVRDDAELAGKWASNPVDEPVTGTGATDRYSAWHWSYQARQHAQRASDFLDAFDVVVDKTVTLPVGSAASFDMTRDGAGRYHAEVGIPTGRDGYEVPVGMVEMWAGIGSTVPPGWLLCDGRALSRVTYAELFAVCGTSWGAGDGVSTFNIPDLVTNGRFPRSAGALHPLGTYEVDMMRNVTGSSSFEGYGVSRLSINGSGAFAPFGKPTKGQVLQVANLWDDNLTTGLSFDASRQVQTGAEFRPYAACINFIIKAFNA